MATLTRRKTASAPAVTVTRKEPSAVQFYATCPRGLAGALAEELSALGAAQVQAGEAGVEFEGPFELAYAANLESRLATRILAPVVHAGPRRDPEVHARAASAH